MKLCKFCTGAIPSPHHTAQCLSKSIEEWIAIANGLQNQTNGNLDRWRKDQEKIVFWQGKYTMVKNENNKLRKRNDNIYDNYIGLCRKIPVKPQYILTLVCEQCKVNPGLCREILWDGNKPVGKQYVCDKCILLAKNT